MLKRNNADTVRLKGFTIIELLIVIIVIGILATLVSYNYAGSQARSRDAKRLADAKAIEAALESYRSENVGYPASSTATQVGGASTGGWETSAAAQPGTFLSALKQHGFESGVPVDPKNNTLSYTGNTYRYATYPAGDWGCDINKGNYYVFIINDFETITGTSPKSPGFSCASRNWQTEGDYVFGGFVNDY